MTCTDSVFRSPLGGTNDLIGHQHCRAKVLHGAKQRLRKIDHARLRRRTISHFIGSISPSRIQGGQR